MVFGSPSLDGRSWPMKYLGSYAVVCRSLL